MTTRLGSSSSLPLIAVVLVGGLGIAGYRLMSGDCSSCTAPDANAAATTVATEESSCCAELSKAETIMASNSEASSSCCSSDGEGQNVALASESATESCCAGDTLSEAEACCEDKSACQESTETTTQISTVSETKELCPENCTKPCCAG